MIILLTAMLERAIRHYLALDPQALNQLATLTGKVVKMELPAWNAVFYLFPDPSGIRLQNYYEGVVDATLKGSPLSLFRLSLARDGKATALTSEITIEGNVEVAHRLSQIMQQVEIDWEEPLSQIVGDVAAHQIGNAVRGVKRWSEAFWRSTLHNVTDYLQEESRHLPPRQEVEDFFTDIYTLHNDVERLAAGLQQQRLK